MMDRTLVGLAIVAVLIIGWIYIRVRREDLRQESLTLPERWIPPKKRGP